MIHLSRPEVLAYVMMLEGEAQNTHRGIEVCFYDWEESILVDFQLILF